MYHYVNKEVNTMTMYEIIQAVGMDKISNDLNIPRRSLENWYYNVTEPLPYLVTLLAAYYKLGGD